MIYIPVLNSKTALVLHEMVFAILWYLFASVAYSCQFSTQLKGLYKHKISFKPSSILLKCHIVQKRTEYKNFENSGTGLGFWRENYDTCCSVSTWLSITVERRSGLTNALLWYSSSHLHTYHMCNGLRRYMAKYL